jgi:hypothetical protein
MMTNGLLRTLTHNSPLKRLLASSGVALATTSFCAYHLVRGYMEKKPHNPTQTPVNINSHIEIFHHKPKEIRQHVNTRNPLIKGLSPRSATPPVFGQALQR